ncbi:MAG TPA: cytochrome c family protein, partial [Lacipirellulaceae bacterium]|nr:cytochrome c family protein [Lacipirellulaceae bacterium]
MNSLPRLIAALLSTVGLGAALAARADDYGFVRCDPAQVLGPDSCTKCHAAEMLAWQQTPHYATFETLHRRPEAKQIAERLGLRSVKRNDECTKCHFTTQTIEGQDRVVAGVSCESCHGAARNWVEMHADYGAPGLTHFTEPPEHRRERVARSIAAGMNNPANLYLVARQCLACHTSPNERLVNVGGHAAGTPDFELVAWSQGKVRHNFVASGGAVNAQSSPDRLRVMFVVGVLADLEASLRATAMATEKAPFGVAAAQRGARQKRRLYEISQLIDNPHVAAALDAALGVRLQLNNRDALLSAADAVGRAAYEF